MTNHEFLAEYLKYFPENQHLCDEHISDFPDILGHIFAARAVNDEMLSAFGNNDKAMFERFCRFIEHIWSLVHDDGDEILNIIDVTILERISDAPEVWQAFGGVIKGNFKEYINNTVLTGNMMMTAVERLKF